MANVAGSSDCLAIGFIHRIGHLWNSTEQDIEMELRFGQAPVAINCGFAGARGIMCGMSAGAVSSYIDSIMETETVPDIGSGHEIGC